MAERSTASSTKENKTTKKTPSLFLIKNFSLPKIVQENFIDIFQKWSLSSRQSTNLSLEYLDNESKVDFVALFFLVYDTDT